MNHLYPTFFRLDRLVMLVVGAGEVGEEKLRFILKSSPNANVIVIAPWMGGELKELLESYEGDDVHANVPLAPHPAGVYASNVAAILEKAKEDARHAGHYRTATGGEVVYLAREFKASDVEWADLVVAATNFTDVNRAVWKAAKAARRPANIADTPSLCDFYLGSIVTRGPLKVAISTNGQSPTFAKRFRQWLEAELPEFETTSLLDNLKLFRDRLTGDFQTKVRELNRVTSSLLASTPEKEGEETEAAPPHSATI